MHLRPLAIGLILFGLLALGGTVDGAYRKFMQQPEWVALNWKSFLKGIIGWCAVGSLSLVVGIVGVFI